MNVQQQTLLPFNDQPAVSLTDSTNTSTFTLLKTTRAGKNRNTKVQLHRQTHNDILKWVETFVPFVSARILKIRNIGRMRMCEVLVRSISLHVTGTVLTGSRFSADLQSGRRIAPRRGENGGGREGGE